MKTAKDMYVAGLNTGDKPDYAKLCQDNFEIYDKRKGKSVGQAITAKEVATKKDEVSLDEIPF